MNDRSVPIGSIGLGSRGGRSRIGGRKSCSGSGSGLESNCGFIAAAAPTSGGRLSLARAARAKKGSPAKGFHGNGAKKASTRSARRMPSSPVRLWVQSGEKWDSSRAQQVGARVLGAQVTGRPADQILGGPRDQPRDLERCQMKKPYGDILRFGSPSPDC